MKHIDVSYDQKGFSRLMIVLAILGTVVWALFIGFLVARGQSPLPALELVGEVPSQGDYAIKLIDAIHFMNDNPNEILFSTENQGAGCGGGDPESIWKMTLDPATGTMTSLRHVQDLFETQTAQSALFESSDGTLFTGGGWCGYTPLYYSTDAGETWQPSNVGVHPTNSTYSYVEFNGQVYAGTGYAPDPGGVYRWLGAAGPNQWELVLTVPAPRTIVSPMTVYHDRLFVGSYVYWWEGEGCESSTPVYVSSDGDTFAATTGIPPCYSVRDLVIAGDQLIALANYYDDGNQAYLYRWNEATQEWEQLSHFPLGIARFRSLKAHNGVLYAINDPADGVFRSFDLGQTWERIATLDAGIVGWTVHNNALYLGTYGGSFNVQGANPTILGDAIASPAQGTNSEPHVVQGTTPPNPGGTTAYIYRIRLRGLSADNDGPTLIGQPTTLSAFLTDGASYAWDLGDGTTADGATVTHVYPAVGVYTAMVVASDSEGALTATTTVIVNDVPITGLVVSGDDPTWLGQPTTFLASIAAGSNVTYAWDWGDGSGVTQSAGGAVAHTYAAPGRYTVTVTASNSAGVVTVSVNVAVYRIIAVNFTASPTTGPAPLAVGFANTTPGSYTTSLWDFGDGATSTLANPTHVYSMPGSYTVTLAVTAPDGLGVLSRGSWIVVKQEPPCPVTKALGDAAAPRGWTGDVALDVLRRLRDEVMAQSPVGQRYIALYYAHAEEITRILAQDPKLTLRVGKLLWRYLPDIQTMLGSDSTLRNGIKPQVIDAKTVAEVTKLLDAIAAKASPELRALIEWQKPFLKGYIGLRVAQAWEKAIAGPLPGTLPAN